MTLTELCTMATRLAAERTDGTAPALYLLVERMRPVLVELAGRLLGIERRQDQLDSANEALRVERDTLIRRRDELLATIAKISQENPFPDEIRNWTDQRAKLIAEVGSLRAERDEWRRRAQAHGVKYDDGDPDCG